MVVRRARLWRTRPFDRPGRSSAGRSHTPGRALPQTDISLSARRGGATLLLPPCRVPHVRLITQAHPALTNTRDPAEGHSVQAMSAAKETPVLYAASCNPPRRAKRQRTGSLGEGPSSPTVSTSPQQRRTAAAARPPILPKQPAGDREYVAPASPDSDSGSDGEDDYDPSRDAAPAPKRRGRKPGTMSRSARESLRKLNHSKIEKARRTKINETLATLSMLVNDRERVLPSAGKAGAEIGRAHV